MATCWTSAYLRMDRRSFKRSYAGAGFKRRTRRRVGGFRPFGTQRAQRYSTRTSGLAETKYFDVGIANTQTWGSTDWSASEVPCDNYVNSSGTAAAYTDSCLVPTAIGSGYGQVNGNRYLLKKIRVRGRVQTGPLVDQDNAPTAAYGRLLLIMDTQPNGAQAQGEDILQDIGGNENLYSFKRTATTSGRFRILKDKFMVFQPATAPTDGSNTNSSSFESRMFSFQYVPKKPILVNIESGNSTPTVGGTVNCNIFMLLAVSINGSPQAANIQAASRCYFTD